MVQVKFTAKCQPYDIGDIAEITEEKANTFSDFLEIIETKTIEGKQNKAILSPKETKWSQHSQN